MDCFHVISFETELGWTGLLMDGEKILRIKFGFPTEVDMLGEIENHVEDLGTRIDVRVAKRREQPWVSRLQKFAAGERVDLSDIPIDLSGYSKFQGKVLRQCRKIPYGKTLSYGKLAAQCQSPNAARAVGSVMRKNKFALVVPCHRVVSSNGIGGYSAGDGVSIKRRLLAREGVNM